MTTLAERFGYGDIGYSAYRVALLYGSGESDVPEFDELPIPIRNAWISAADSVKDAVLTDLRAHMAIM